jgi:lipopolysaccharide transport system permease protein
MGTKTVVYLPPRSIKDNYLELLRQIFRESYRSRWLTYQLFRRNFTSTYRQSVIGVFWALILPFLSVATFLFLNAGGVLNVGQTSVPYPIYAISGIALWQVFSVGIALGSGSLAGAGNMLTKINFDRESLVFSSVAQGIVPSLVQAAIVLVLFGAYWIAPPWTLILAPFAAIPLLLLTLGLAFIFALANGVVRDVGYGVAAIVTFLLFVTPVLYTRPATGIVAEVSKYNPLYYLVAVPRDLLTTGVTTDLSGYLYSALFSAVVFLVCWMAFHIAEIRVIERL